MKHQNTTNNATANIQNTNNEKENTMNQIISQETIDQLKDGMSKLSKTDLGTMLGMTASQIKRTKRSDIEAAVLTVIDNYNNTQKEENTMNTENTTPATVDTMNTENKEDKNMTTNATAPKKLTKKAAGLIQKIEDITHAYGDRLQTLSTADLTDLYRMLRARAKALAKEAAAEKKAEERRNAEPKPTAAQKLATAAERLTGYYDLYTNAKGHLYIRDTESGKTLAKVYTNRKGVTLMPRTDMVDALPDKGWEYHPGWASKFSLVLADMDAVWAVLDEYWTVKEDEAEEQ